MHNHKDAKCGHTSHFRPKCQGSHAQEVADATNTNPKRACSHSLQLVLPPGYSLRRRGKLRWQSVMIMVWEWSIKLAHVSFSFDSSGIYELLSVFSTSDYERDKEYLVVCVLPSEDHGDSIADALHVLGVKEARISACEAEVCGQLFDIGLTFARP